MVAKSPRTGVGPGFDSQGSVILFHKYCIPNLYWIHWAIPWWSDSAINSNIQVHDIFRMNRPGEKDVVGLDVQMDNVLAMYEFKTLQN